MSLLTILSSLLLIPIIVYSVNRKLYARKLKKAYISAISAVFVYILILSSVVYIENKLNSELTAFDLNGDGIFSGSEITPEQEHALYRITADTGRTLAPITGAVFSVLYFLVLWLVCSIFPWVKKWHASKNT